MEPLSEASSRIQPEQRPSSKGPPFDGCIDLIRSALFPSPFTIVTCSLLETLSAHPACDQAQLSSGQKASLGSLLLLSLWNMNSVLAAFFFFKHQGAHQCTICSMASRLMPGRRPHRGPISQDPSSRDMCTSQGKRQQPSQSLDIHLSQFFFFFREKWWFQIPLTHSMTRWLPGVVTGPPHHHTCHLLTSGHSTSTRVTDDVSFSFSLLKAGR